MSRKRHRRYEALQRFDAGPIQGRGGVVYSGTHAKPVYLSRVADKPDDADIYNNLCVALGMAGRYEEAIQSCKQAIGLKPDLAEAHNNLGWTYQKLGRHQESIRSCKEAIHLKPDFLWPTIILVIIISL
jgi:tetratricopeptide (TPR) repeat protein